MCGVFPFDANIVEHSAPSEFVTVCIGTASVHPKIPLFWIALVEPVESVRACFHLDSEAAH